MAITLPGHLVTAMQYLGYEFPSANEDVLTANATAFTQAGTAATTAISDIEAAIKHVTDNNSGFAYQAFVGYHRSDDSNLSSLRDFKEAADLISSGFTTVAGIVVTLKLAVIAQLVILAAAIVAAIASGGIAAGGVVLAREAAKRLIDLAINVAIEQVIG